MGKRRKPKKGKIANIKLKARESRNIAKDIPKPKTKLERSVLKILFPNFFKKKKK